MYDAYKISDGQDGEKGKFIKSYSSHHMFPQVTKHIIDKHNEFFNDLFTKVKCYFSHKDARIIDDDGLQYLKDNDMIGKKLGQFKIEHTFVDVAIKSQMVWMAIKEDGSVFKHFHNAAHKYDHMTYEEFVSS
jgi:ribosomal protein S19